MWILKSHSTQRKKAGIATSITADTQSLFFSKIMFKLGEKMVVTAIAYGGHQRSAINMNAKLTLGTVIDEAFACHSTSITTKASRKIRR